MVQDRDIVAMEDYLEIVCSILNGSNTNDLECTSAVWNLPNLYTMGSVSCIIYSMFIHPLQAFPNVYKCAAVD